MLPIYVCDDNKELLKQIEAHIKTYIQFKNENIDLSIYTYSDAYKFQRVIDTIDSTGIYFLDIQLDKNISGLDLADEIRKRDPFGFIIFVSTFEEYIPQTFSKKLSAMDFIVKDKGNLFKQISDSLSVAFSRYQLMLSKPEPHSEMLTLNFKNSTEFFEQRQIVYIQTVMHKHSITIYQVCGSIKLPLTLAEIFEKLDKRYFLCAVVLL